REQEELRPRSHRGQVRQVDREGAAAQLLRFLRSEEIDSLDQQVGGGGETPLARSNDGGVVPRAHPDSGTVWQEPLKRFNEAVFGRHGSELLFLESGFAGAFFRPVGRADESAPPE